MGALSGCIVGLVTGLAVMICGDLVGRSVGCAKYGERVGASAGGNVYGIRGFVFHGLSFFPPFLDDVG